MVILQLPHVNLLKHGFEPFVKSNISELLLFDISSARYSRNDMLNLLLGMSAFNSYAEGTSNSFSTRIRCPTSDTLLSYLKSMDRFELLSTSSMMMERLVKNLKSKGLLKNKPVYIAMDWHDDMYYGDTAADMVNGTKPRAGTSYAYQYMTASLLLDGTRLVVYAMPIKSRSMLVEYVRDAIAFITNRLQLQIAGIALDAGFFSEDMVSYLESMKCNYVIRLPANAKVKSMCMKHGDRVRYRFTDCMEADLVCCIVDDDDGKLTYYLMTNIVTCDADKLLDMYRKRWAIETSYRIIEQFMPQTTSKSYEIRLFYFLFAVWMYNLWILFNMSQQGYGVIVLAFKVELLVSIIMAATSLV
jgi:hypothetical protein